jgi:hypothetical protein
METKRFKIEEENYNICIVDGNCNLSGLYDRSVSRYSHGSSMPVAQYPNREAALEAAQLECDRLNGVTERPGTKRYVVVEETRYYAGDEWPVKLVDLQTGTVSNSYRRDAIDSARERCDRLNAEAEKAEQPITATETEMIMEETAGRTGMTPSEWKHFVLVNNLDALERKVDELVNKFADYKEERGKALVKVNERIQKLEAWQRSHDPLPKEELKPSGEEKSNRWTYWTNKSLTRNMFDRNDKPNPNGCDLELYFGNHSHMAHLCDILNAGEDALQLAELVREWLKKFSPNDPKSEYYYGEFSKRLTAIRRKMRGE